MPENLERPPGLFVTGTDTAVGKTWVTCMIARAVKAQEVRVGAYKPVCSGAVLTNGGQTIWPDCEALQQAIGDPYPIDLICPQRFIQPLAPHVAARLEGREADTQQLVDGAGDWRNRVDFLLVEGVGGLLCPLSATMDVAQLAVRLDYPLIVVARTGLGTINHTLLTISAARQHGLRVAGIVLNEVTPTGDSPAAAEAFRTNPGEITARTEIPVLGIVRHGSRKLCGTDHERTIEVDWQQLASGSSM